MPRIFSSEDVQNIRNMLFDAEAGGDVEFWLYATVAYAIFRVATEALVPGKIRGFTTQQYVVTLFHQMFVLPCCCVAWALGVPSAPELIYLLTGAYLASDSVINYTPVSGCVAASLKRGVTPDFSWGIHAHHLFTVVLCALGTNMPPWPVLEGAICILLGEAGSLWITVTLLRPKQAHFNIRYYSFLLTRVSMSLIGLDILQQVWSDSWTSAVVLAIFFAGLLMDNANTLRAMHPSLPRTASGVELVGGASSPYVVEKEE